jgi:hypothetical protein
LCRYVKKEMDRQMLHYFIGQMGDDERVLLISLFATPQLLAEEMFLLYESWLAMKLESTTDEVFRSMIQFIQLTNLYERFLASGRSGNSCMLEYIYVECIPFWLCMGKKHCVAIALQQIEDFYQRIPSWLLQKVREERCQAMYDGTDKRGRPMASRYIDEVIETLMISYHQMSFRCTANDWRKHSVHMPLFRKCKAFHDSEYSKRNDIPSFEELYVDGIANGSNTDKLNQKRAMSIPRAEAELAFIADLLTKAKCCKEVPGRVFKSEHFWEALKVCEVVVPERLDENNNQQG